MDYLAKADLKYKQQDSYYQTALQAESFGASITADMVSGDEITKALQEVSVI